MTVRTIMTPLVYPRLPVFVYGTLRRGEGNHPVIERFACGVHSASLAQHRLYVSGLPYAAPGAPGDLVIGDLVSLDPDLYEIGMAALDRLEGVESGLYLRRAVNVRYTCGTTARTALAWVYLGGDGFAYHDTLIVPDGDYTRRTRGRIRAYA